jgi:hypothetical protein
MKRMSVVLAIALGALGAGCTVTGTGTMRVSGGATVVYQEPPQPQIEQPKVERPGYLWVTGHWDWQSGQWQWIGGRWEAEHPGYAWTAGRWERRGNAWYWIEGRWVQANGTVEVRDHREGEGEGVEVRGGGDVVLDVNGDAPNVEPPAPKHEDYGAPRTGFVWIAGRWTWRRGTGWQWQDGHWDQARTNQSYVAGKWELRGRRWIWVEGHWQ